MAENEKTNDLGPTPEPPRMAGAHYDVVAIAASAGGLRAFSTVFSELPSDFPAAIVALQHLDPHHRSLLAVILARRTRLNVREAVEGDLLTAGWILLAPPDEHLLVNPDGSVSLSHAGLVHFVRPSADLLFESVAASYRERAIAVVLSGAGSDGAMGVQAIKKTGGLVLVQDQASSEFYGMPGSAISTGSPDYILPLTSIAGMLLTLVCHGRPGPPQDVGIEEPDLP